MKFDVNRLTEHQKETLKKKRDDIPALYNDLSQSSSQNSQNLQEWFDKAKKKRDSVTQKSNNNDADDNEKNVVAEFSVTKQLTITDKTVNDNSSEKLDVNIEEDIVEQNEDLTKETDKESSDLHNEDIDTHTNSEQTTILEADKETDVTNSVAKKLNFESREEFPEDEKLHERQSSPSMLDSIKRRHRNSMTKSNSSLKSDEAVESQKDSSAANVQRSSRTKINQEKPSTSDVKPHDDTDVKENENKKNIKRKFVSDSESDMQQRRKRKVMPSSKSSNDDDSDKSRDSDNASLDITDLENVSQKRVKNEMTRLKIDMVFDCPAVNRRRVKHLEEGETTSKKTSTPDNKNVKPKLVDTKSIEVQKRFPKTMEKNAKDTNANDQGTLKRRGRRSMKQESDKNDLDVNKESKKSNDTNKTSQVKSSTDAEITVRSSHVTPTSSQAQDVITVRAQDEILDKDNSKCSLNKNEESSEITETTEQSQDEIEDVIENSQAPSGNLKLDKICSEKQCFIKINKMTEVHAVKASDATIENNYVPESIPVDCGDNDVPDPCEQPNDVNFNNNAEIDDKGNKNSINKDSVQESDNSNAKTIVPEGQKAVDSSAAVKSAGVTNFSSPKGSNKLFSSKLKPFTAHGRAAHMLGLVTKQSRIESDNLVIVTEDDSNTVKKLRLKDVESETSTSKKMSTAKENMDKISGSSGSRQEKMFSNMRSADYCISPSTYAFTTLKNDGEKLSSKLNKSTSDCLSVEGSGDKENEGNISPSREKDDLPILEWSSANPPSLTASPSASILKRQRSTIPEPDPDCTTPKVLYTVHSPLSEGARKLPSSEP